MGKNEVPDSFKKYFWDVDFKKINSQKSAQYIIHRLLNFGNDRAIGWLFSIFDKETIKIVLRERRGFSKRAAMYWGKFFNMPRREIMYFKKGFPNPPTRLWQY